jgi:predicted alpha/beta superfamily hydrolase
MRTATLAVAAALLSATASYSAALKVVSEGPALQLEAKAFVLHSRNTGRDYLVEITPPPVAAPLPGQKFPIVLSLDGGYGVAGPEGRMLVALAAMQASYMVAVGYPPGQYGARPVDLTHQTFQNEGKTEGGGGAAFEAFLLEELGPFLEARYPVAMKRSVLFGHSLGGLFTANLLARHPDAFAGYIIASPSVQRDESVVAKVAAAQGKGQQVWVTVGGKEPDYMLSGAKRIAEALSRPGSGFKVQSRVYPDDGHLNYYPALVLAAFPALLPRAQPAPDQSGVVSLDPATYARYAGAYRLADGRTVSIAAKGDKLMGQLTGFPAMELTPQSPTQFFIRGADVLVTFEDPNPAPALVLRLNGSDARATRVN